MRKERGRRDGKLERKRLMRTMENEAGKGRKGIGRKRGGGKGRKRVMRSGSWGGKA